MLEADKGKLIPKIPDSWNFPERDIVPETRLKSQVSVVDEKRRYLYLIKPNFTSILPQHDNPTLRRLDPQREREYFFKPNGDPEFVRKIPEKDIVHEGEIRTWVNWESKYDWPGFEEAENKIRMGFEEVKRDNRGFTPYSVLYLNGHLKQVYVGTEGAFEEKEINFGVVVNRSESNPLDSNSWVFFKGYYEYFLTLEQNEKRKIRRTNPVTGKDETMQGRVIGDNPFVLEPASGKIQVGWNIEQREINGEEQNVLVVTQQPEGSEFMREVVVPFNVDHNRLVGVMEAKYPYQENLGRNGLGAWDVPWQRADREIGVTIGYRIQPQGKK